MENKTPVNEEDIATLCWKVPMEYDVSVEEWVETTRNFLLLHPECNRFDVRDFITKELQYDIREKLGHFAVINMPIELCHQFSHIVLKKLLKNKY